MRYLLTAALACLALLPAPGLAAPSLSPALFAGQFGLDLSDEEKKPDKDKKGKKKGKKADAEEKPKAAETGTPPGGMGLDLSGSGAAGGGAATAADPTKKDKAAPVMSFDAVDVSGKSAERQRLDAANKLFKADSYETAALAYAEVLRDPKMLEWHDEAQYSLAKSLYRMQLYHSALNIFKKQLAKGPSGKYFKASLEWLFYIAHKTVNEQIVLDEVAKYANQEFPERFRSEFRYLLARYHFARGKALNEANQADEAKKSFEEAKRLVLLVPKGDPFYGKVKYLEGTIFFQEGLFAQSLESFKDTVRSNNPRLNPKADMNVRELAFMQLARTHYGHKQNRYAIYYYDKVARGSDQWLEALFEASWAHFRIGEYERALGNLITLSSPFFKDEYFPEALILKAVVYYERCRYREARAILDEFARTYEPVHDELERITAQNIDSQGYWDILAEIQRRNREGERGASLLLERILKLALSDKDLKAVNDSILEVEKEMDTVNEREEMFRYSDLAKGSLEDLKAERVGLMKKAGILAKAKLELELGSLKDLLGQALRIKFETTTKEKEFLEAQLLEGAAKKEQLKKYKYSVAVGDERLYWPYEGEYWRDELGTYEYTLTKGCKND